MVDLAKKGPVGLNGLTACEASAQLEAGDITSEALVRDCLARIEARDADVLAWDYIDPDYAIEQAKARDAEPRRGPLHGVPVGIKDIFDTIDMPTAHGFAPYEGKHWGIDSACVASLRAAGMVLMGKTVTTQFACSKPRQTRNPHDPTRTPGVSSSGSAAAVADFMIPLANGTQTGGSVIGPAANCGIYGYKASLDGLDRGGFRHCKKSIDTIGLFARTIDDLILLRAVNTGRPVPTDSVSSDQNVRVGVAHTSEWDGAEPYMQAAVERAADLLGQHGATVTHVNLPPLFKEIIPDFTVINGWEATRMLAIEIRENLDSFNDLNADRVKEASTYTEEQYAAAGRRLDAARDAMDEQFAAVDVFISPSLPGEPPVGLTETRAGGFARLWTQMYTPAVNLPLFTGPNDMPVCFQVTGPRGSDDATLAFANWIDARLRAALGDVPASV
jgi:Asp-tRNA(Asn)/Glu-tRNA(Gln) amidotransferase A subunit family amidase